MKKNDVKALFAAIVASGTDDLNMMFLAFSMSSIMADLSLNAAQTGFIGTVTNLGMLVGGLFFGVLADRYHKFKVFKWTVVIFSIATGLIFFASNLTTLYILRFIAGIGIGGEYGIAIAIMAGIVPASKMGRISSLNGVAGQMGAISSALIAGYLLPQLGWRGLFLFGLAPLLLVLWMHLSIDDHAITDNSVFDRIPSGQKPHIREIFATPQLTAQTIALMIMATVQIAGYFGLMNWLPSIMEKSLNISVKSSSQWMIITIIGMSCGMLVFGRLLDTYGPRLVYGCFLLASAAAVYLYQFASTPLAMILGGALVGFFVNGMFAGYGAVVSRLYAPHIRSIANNTILNVGRAIGGFSSLAIGLIMDHSGISAVMIFLASLYLVSLVAMLSIKNLSRKRYFQEAAIIDLPQEKIAV